MTIFAMEQNAARRVPFSCWRTSLSALEDLSDMPGNLIYWALILIVIALVAAFLGFGGVAGTAMGGASPHLACCHRHPSSGVVLLLICRA